MTEKHNGKCKYFMSPIQSAVKKKKKNFIYAEIGKLREEL